MSKIIKRSELLISQPKIIDLSTMYELEKIKRESLASLENIAVEENTGELDAEVDDRIEKERQELERLKLESEKILNETEHMVMELLQKVRDEAKTIISNAHEEAEVVREKVYEEAAKIRETSHKEGYDHGLKNAQEEIEADRMLAIEQSQKLLEEARQTKLNMMKASESDMVRLAMAVAKKVIGGELTTNPNIIVNVLREALGFLDQPGNVTVYVNPQDVERIFKVMETESFTDIGSNDMQINIYADDRITAGGCMLESDAGSADSRLETRIANMEKAVQEVTTDE
ncbi:MAG: FliH/SctL family protein [Syntrophomonadaceae bacterium]|nr:FliH/SctL family protein [Syntrophomonadaceae bacterium]